MNLVFYLLVYNYINSSINNFMTQLSYNVMGVAGGVALVLMTIWILIQGYRIVTGQSREPMMGFVVNSMRVVFIVSTATSLGVFGSNLHDLFTGALQTDLNQLFTGSNATFQTTIDQNLAYTIAAEAAIDGIQTAPGDDSSVAAKSRAADFAIFGTASPPMAAGAMMLMYNLALALFIGLGPIFILCLLFDQTKPLFQKWLLYGIGTIFSMAMLSFVSGVVLSVTLRAAAAFWASSAINGLIGSTSEGLTTQSMEQGGIGLLMTMLLISAPPMAANFFSGTLGQFTHFSAFGGGAGAGGAAAAGRPGPLGQPAGSYAGGGSRHSSRAPKHASEIKQEAVDSIIRISAAWQGKPTRRKLTLSNLLHHQPQRVSYEIRQDAVAHSSNISQLRRSCRGWLSAGIDSLHRHGYEFVRADTAWLLSYAATGSASVSDCTVRITMGRNCHL